MSPLLKSKRTLHLFLSTSTFDPSRSGLQTTDHCPAFFIFRLNSYRLTIHLHLWLAHDMNSS